ncbi:phosphotransferase [Thalassotalea sp. Y01]|nr:phosphotransferase [Thalassotalea sp. Y01]
MLSAQSRIEALTRWLTEQFSSSSIQLQALTGDAGFRRYFRFEIQGKRYIAVDSPPDKCNNEAFFAIATAMKAKHIHVPAIYHYHQSLGFFCLEDLGETLLSDKLTPHTMPDYYRLALTELAKIQSLQDIKDWQLPVYDGPFLQMEMDIFSEWLVTHYLDISLTELQQQQLQQCFQVLIDSALEQPQTVVHRDFHSRNLMLTGADEPLAVIDFQDAVIGPVTYDLVSLLRDCYVRWPQQQIAPLVCEYYQQWAQPVPDAVSYQHFQRWFDLMGLQRHVKASGIFARLYLRDNKPGYLNDIPLTLSYVVDIAAKYPELQFLSELVAQQVLPLVADKQEQQ